jgi:predicted DNA-binding protein
MVRTQVQLSEEQAGALRRLAAERGVSMAEIVRQSVEAYLRDSRPVSASEARERALGLIGAIREGPADISARHDEYAAEAFEE